MRWARRTLTGACAALTICACSTDGGRANDIVTVQWRDYAPSLQTKIDAMAKAKDCEGLQAEFNDIGATNLAMRTKFGHGNVEILVYIDKREREANCFDDVTTTT